MIRYVEPKKINGIGPKFIIKIENNIKTILWDVKTEDYNQYLIWLSQGNTPEPFESI